MPHTPEEEDKLLIRCPECRQRFKVQPEFQNRMVECGVCEHRFYIRDEVIIRVRKFYPGEKRHHGLTRFQRVSYSQPIHDSMPASETLPPEPAPVIAYQPLPPQRILAGLAGVSAMIAIALLIIFGSDHGGILDGMTIAHKLIMACFTAVMGFALLLYANPNTRPVAALIGGLIACMLVALPFLVQESDSTLEQIDVPVLLDSRDDSQTPEPKDPQERLLEQMRERAGVRPLEQEIERLAAEEGDRQAYGLFLVDLQESNRIAVRDYMFRVTSADPSSHIYPRDENEYLFVLSGLDINIERLAALASPLGKVRIIVPELNIIELVVDNEVFTDAPSGKMVDREDPDYYELNLTELRSIDLQRIQRAVTRLSESEPRMYRTDITRRLHELLEEPGITFHAAIAKALSVWDADTKSAAAAATETAIRLEKDDRSIPSEIIALAIEHPSPELIPVLVKQWRSNTLMWENYCIQMGPMIEQAMLKEFETNDPSLKQSAARILARVGGEQSRIILNAARDNDDRELEVIINRALEVIDSRIGGES